jgi:uncharacterized protein (DUF4415 family)
MTIYLDNETLQRFKAAPEGTGKSYQALINEALSQHKVITRAPLQRRTREPY